MPLVDQYSRPVRYDRAYRVGRLVSQVFHPIVNGVASFILVGIRASGLRGMTYGLTWACVCMLTLIGPPAFYFYMHLNRGAYSDDDVSHRSERYGLYLIAIVSAIAGSGVLYLLGVPTIFLRLMIAAIGVTGISMLINFRWKISVHSASIATLSTLATIFFQGFGMTLWLCAIVVGWARVRTGNHTPLQVLAGWGVAIVGVVLAFRLGT
jgi:membrane-associated phospholipid phosphatase